MGFHSNRDWFREVGEDASHIGCVCDILEESSVGGTGPFGLEVGKSRFKSVLEVQERRRQVLVLRLAVLGDISIKIHVLKVLWNL